MKSQRKARSQCIRLPGPAQLWFLTSTLLVAVLVLPGLGSLLCNHCPLHSKNKPCANTSSQCLPTERCCSFRGRYGALHVLSGQGCVTADLCGSYRFMSHKGIRYNISYSCCCKDLCNPAPLRESYLKQVLEMTKHLPEYSHLGNLTDVTLQEPWDSCANYTANDSPVTTSLVI